MSLPPYDKVGTIHDEPEENFSIFHGSTPRMREMGHSDRVIFANTSPFNDPEAVFILDEHTARNVHTALGRYLARQDVARKTENA